MTLCMTGPKFTISILTYTAIAEMKRCIHSVLSHSRDFKLILTANGSSEAAAYFNEVKAKLPNGIVTAIVNQQNLGFIEPNRKALVSCHTPFFVMLNDDCEVCDGWLEKLESPFLQYPKAALSGPMGGCSSLRSNLDGYCGPAFEYLDGSCLMGNTEILKRHGVISDYLTFAYGEDSDLSLRLRRLGYTLHQVDIKVRHARSTTAKLIPGLRQIQLRNQSEIAKRFRHYLRVRKFGYPITVVRGGAWGDVLLTTPIIEALAKKNPLSKICVETGSPAVFLNNPHVARAENSIKREDTSEQRINLNMAYENRPSMNYLQAFAEAAAVDDVGLPKLYLSQADNDFSRAALKDGQWCAIHPGPSWTSRTWQLERWSPVVEQLHSKGYKVVRVGQKQPSDISVACDLDLCGQTTLHQLAAVIARCTLFIGLDSLPLHIANSRGIKTIGLFGITLPDIVYASPLNAYAVCSDPKHPSSGARHSRPGITRPFPVLSNPMDTISVDAVNAKIDEVVA